MSVTINQQALDFLLNDPAGPVGLDLRRRAANITELVRANATKVLEQMDPSLIGFEIRNGEDGLEAVIGVEGAGRFSSYLAEKEGREQVIFAPALQQGLHT